MLKRRNSSVLAKCCAWNYTAVEKHRLPIKLLEISRIQHYNPSIWSRSVCLQHDGVVSACTVFNEVTSPDVFGTVTPGGVFINCSLMRLTKRFFVVWMLFRRVQHGTLLAI